MQADHGTIPFSLLLTLHYIGDAVVQFSIDLRSGVDAQYQKTLEKKSNGWEELFGRSFV